MATLEVPKTCKVVMAETIAKNLLSEVQHMLQEVKEAAGDSGPCLVAFLANDDPAAVKYAEWSKKTCEEKCGTLRWCDGLVCPTDQAQWLLV